MISNVTIRTSRDQQPDRINMSEPQREEFVRMARRAAGPELRAAREAEHPLSAGELDAARDRAREAALAALVEAGLGRAEALAFAERAARGLDEGNDLPATCAQPDLGRYPAQVGDISWPLLADGYTITWAPAPAGCSLTLDRHGPGGHDAYRGTGPTMQRAWNQVRAQLGHGEPQTTAGTGHPSSPSPSS
jgi:hypothetical protein